MALSTSRDLDEVTTQIAAWLQTRASAPVADLQCERPSDGMSIATVLVRARVGGNAESMVLRLPPVGPGAFPHYDLVVQAQAQQLAAAHGVPAAVPVELVSDRQWLGVPFLVMPLVDGHILGSVPIANEWLMASTDIERRAVYRNYVDVLACVHAVPVHDTGAVPRRALDDEFAYWRQYLDWYGDGAPIVPALEDAFEWCVAHRPARESDAVLLWGDVRLGNLIFAEDHSVRAVLDWEMVTVGAPEHDLAWMLALEALADEMIGQAMSGFLSRDEAIEHYEAATGRTVRDLEWFEIFALFRSTAILSRITWINEQAGLASFFPLADNPILDVLARRIDRYSEGA